MKNILTKLKINFTTYLFFFSCFLTGYIKQALIIFLIVLVHEFGHVTMAILNGYKIDKIELLPFGGITTIDKPINTPLDKEFKIAIGGFLFQFILFIIFSIFYKFNIIDNSFWQIFIKYNFTIILFNMIFIYPLDGFKILSCFVENFCGYYYAYSILGIISIIFLILFFCLNTIFSLNNYLIISFLIYNIFAYFKIKSKLYYRFLLERYLRNVEYKKIQYEKSLNLKKLRKDYNHYFYVTNGVVNERKVLAKKFDISKRFW